MRSPTRAITTVTFDADETLWAFRAAQDRAFQSALAELRAAVSAARDLDAGGLRRMQEGFVAASDPAASWEERRLDAFRQTLARLHSGDDRLARRLTETYLRVRYNSIELFEDVRPALAALRGRYALGIISNGNTRAGRCGLPGLFDFELYAEDFGGACKPAPRLFEAAMSAAGCSAQELVHVGDSLTEDVCGALGIGAAAVWLNRAGRSAAPDVDPPHEIRSLRALPALLAALPLATRRLVQ